MMDLWLFSEMKLRTRVDTFKANSPSHKAYKCWENVISTRKIENIAKQLGIEHLSIL